MNFQKGFLAAVYVLMLALGISAAAQIQNSDSAFSPEPKEKPGELSSSKLLPLLPFDHTSPIAGSRVEFKWTRLDAAAEYRLEIEEVYSTVVLTVVIPPSRETHVVPSSRLNRSNDLRWRIVALDYKGNAIMHTAWRVLLAPSSECEI